MNLIISRVFYSSGKGNSLSIEAVIMGIPAWAQTWAWSSLDWIWALFLGMCAGSSPNFLTYRRQMAHAWASVFLNAQYRSRLLYFTNYKWSEPSMGCILGLGQPPTPHERPQSLISTLTIYLLFRMWPTRTRAYTDSLTGHGIMIGSLSTNRAHYHVIQTDSHVLTLRQSKIMTRHVHPWKNQCDCTMGTGQPPLTVDLFFILVT